MAKKPSSKPTAGKVFSRSPSFYICYASEIRLRVTDSDFLMTFSVATDMNESTVSMEDQGGVVITPAHAKRLAKVLQAAVDEFEKQVGPIAEQKKAVPEGRNLQ